MTSPPLPPSGPTGQPRRFWLPALAGLAITAVMVAAGLWMMHQQQTNQELEHLQTTRLQGLEDSLKALRSDQRANARALQDAASSNRVLRDEVLGLSQRNALLEQTVERLSADTRQGLQVLRQEEAEVLLANALQRIEYGHDLESARRLYALADGLIAQLEGPQQLNLRQTLLQERTALEAIGPDPRRQLAQALDNTLGGLMGLERTPRSTPAAPVSWWQRLLAPLVEIHPSSADVPLAASQRQQAIDSLQLEATLARAALERNDRDSWQRALERIDDWAVRLWPDGPALQQHRHDLAQLRLSPLAPTIPELGATLAQMRQLRHGNLTP